MSKPLFRSVNDAVEAWLEATCCFAESEFISGETQQTMNWAFGDAARSGTIVFKGIDAAKAKLPVHETIDPIYFSEHRTLWPQENKIEPWSDLQSTRECVRNMGANEPDRTWIAVHVLEPGFSDWINGIKAKHRGEVAAFLKLPRWDLLTVLAWIATRDASFALEMTSKAMSFHGADIRLSLRKVALRRAGQPQKSDEIISLTEAWKTHLAQVLASGHLRALAKRVRLSRSSGIATNVPGVVFPEDGTPGAPLSYEPFDESNTLCALRPIEHLMASQWAEYHDVSFSRAEVLALWPAPALTVVKSAPTKSNLIPANDRSVWTHAEAAAWVVTGDASKNDPTTISDYIDNDWTTSPPMVQGWDKVQDKLAGGVLSASSSTSDAISPAFWQHAWLHFEIVGESLCDVFRRESGPFPVASTPGGDFLQLKIEQHREVRLRSSDVKAAFPIANQSETTGEQALGIVAPQPPDNGTDIASQTATGRMVFRNPGDEVLFQQVCEAMAFDPTLAFTVVVRDTAKGLRMWPSDCENQERLVGRLKKRRARRYLRASA